MGISRANAIRIWIYRIGAKSGRIQSLGVKGKPLWAAANTWQQGNRISV
jgi:hypothetical protein